MVKVNRPLINWAQLVAGGVLWVTGLLSVCSSFNRSSITRIKDSKLYLGDAKQERAVLEASREVTSPKSKLAKPPGFPDSPKEEKNNKNYENEESESEDTDESTEETESEEEPVRPKPTVNSLPSRRIVPTTNSRPKLESESDGSESETEESSASEKEELRKAPTAGSVGTPSASRAQSTPSPVTSPTSRVSSYSSRLGNFPSSKSSSFSRGDKKEEPVQSRSATYPMCTTAAPTSTTSTVDTRRSKFSSASSDDNKEADKSTLSKTARAKRITRRSPTGFVGGQVTAGADEKEDDKQVNDVDSKKPVSQVCDLTYGREYMCV